MTTATRRLAAILAADVAGYSRLMGEDEAGTAQALREHRSTEMRRADVLLTASMPDSRVSVGGR